MKQLRISVASAALAVISSLTALPARPASAQANPASQGGQAPMVPNVAKPFTNWLVRCYPVSSPAPCEMFQIATARRTQQRMISISIVYIPSADRNMVQIALPTGTDLIKGASIQSTGYKSGTLPYGRCDHESCYIETFLGNDAIDALARSAPHATVTIAAFHGKTMLLPLSLNGFKDAHNALVDLARQKAVAPANAPSQPPAGAPPKS